MEKRLSDFAEAESSDRGEIVSEGDEQSPKSDVTGTKGAYHD
jgi:hypothetical protein